MADDRSTPGPRARIDEVHDDDELADVLAAELERYATGAVPVVDRPGAPDLPPPASVVPEQGRPRPSGRRAQTGPSDPAGDGPTAPVLLPRPDAFGQPAGASAAPPVLPRARHRPAGADGPESVAALVRGEPATAPLLPDPFDDVPIRRRSGFRPPPGPTAAPPAAPMTPMAPMDRVLRTGPVSLPEVTATLLEEMVADSGDAGTARSARHASALPSPEGLDRPTDLLPPPAVVPTQPTQVVAHGSALEGTGPIRIEEPGPLSDPLRGTGPLAVPRPLYSDWEQSLRSIGRPRSPWGDDDDSPLVPGAPVDSPTVAMPVQRTGPALRQPVWAPPDPDPDPDADPEPLPPTGRIRRTGRRRAEVAEADPIDAALPEPLRIDADPAADDEGIDDVADAHPRVSAATTGAIDLPLTDPRPRTAPVLVERVRTAILQLPFVPDSPTGSGAAALAGRWLGAFASPLLLVLAFGVAAAGAGPSAGVLLLAGVLAALPAAVRSAAWAATAEPGDREEQQLVGGPGGTAWAVVLLAARAAAASLSVFGIASTVAAWVARTGALGGSASTSAVVTASVVGVLALVVAALPLRATGVLVQVLGAFAAIGSVLLLLLLAPTGTPVPAAAAGGPAAAVAGFAGVGLLLVLCGADVARWRTDLARPSRTAAGTAIGAVAGAVVLAIGLLVASGAEGDPADAFAGALSDGSAADLAGPLAVVLLGTSVVLPVLLMRSAGAAAARLVGGGGERLGVVAVGLLAVAGGLGLLAAGADPAATALAAAGIAGVPVAAWAGIRTAGGAGGRARPLLVGSAVAVLVGWALTDGLLPGLRSPVLDLLRVPDSTGVRGGPFAGLLVAVVVAAGAAALARPRAVRATPRRDPADTVEG